MDLSSLKALAVNRLRDIGGVVDAALAAALEGYRIDTGYGIIGAIPPAQFDLPGAPPTGRRVRAIRGGQVFERITPRADMTPKDGLPGTWGAWLLIDPAGDEPRDPDTNAPEPLLLSWGTLLGIYGPVQLVPLTAEEEAEAIIYGPAHARWGDPNTPCGYADCAMGTGHIGAHLDRDGHPLGLTDPDPDTTPANVDVVTFTTPDTPAGYVEMHNYCNCGHPEDHLPSCPRGRRPEEAEPNND